MLSREDRRDLGHYALLVAFYGLTLAPLLHTATHDESVPHSHAPASKHQPGGAPSDASHGSGSLEHLQAVVLVSPALPPPSVLWTVVRWAHAGEERPRMGEPLRPTSMPQGP